jgi:hypothetical protein
MEGLANGVEMMPCPHCGQDVRRGMVRCRECGKPVVEIPVEGDFALTGHELLPSQDPKCPLCGAVLEPGATDCASCTSALLDQLLRGPETSAPVSGPHSAPPRPAPATTGLRVRRVVAPDDGPPGVSRLREPLRLSAQAPAAATAETIESEIAAVLSEPAAQKSAPTESAVPRKEKPAAPVAPPLAERETTADNLESASTIVETSSACTALLASLASAEVLLRFEIATALGKLGDKQAIGPLERHMSDPDIRVRRAVATALVQLGHPKGQALLDIAERRPAKDVLSAAKSSRSKPRMSSMGSGIDGATLKLVAGAALVIALVGGGAWYMLSSPARPSGSKKSKAAATKKAKTPPKKIRKTAD